MLYLFLSPLQSFENVACFLQIVLSLTCNPKRNSVTGLLSLLVFCDFRCSIIPNLSLYQPQGGFSCAFWVDFSQSSGNTYFKSFGLAYLCRPTWIQFSTSEVGMTIQEKFYILLFLSPLFPP